MDSGGDVALGVIVQGDGKIILAGEASATGDVAVWLMNAAVVKSSGDFGAVPPSWRIVRLCDFNNDCRQDFLWRNSDGTVAIWLMNGTSIIGTGNLGVVPTRESLRPAGREAAPGAGGVGGRNADHFFTRNQPPAG